MNMKSKLQYTLLAICVTNVLVLTACGGGGGGGMVRSTPPLLAQPSAAATCAQPLTNPCTVNPPAGNVARMDGGWDTDNALLKRGAGELYLAGNYRFGGGTTVEDGWLKVESTLTSNVTVGATGTLRLGSRLIGNLGNNGMVQVTHTTIEGNYTQSSSGQLFYYLPWPGEAGPQFRITGNANLNGGTLHIWGSIDQLGSGQYILPSTPSSYLILHADGGVSGAFDRWQTTPDLFMQGSIRYGSNDIWYDLTRVSVQAAMANAGVDPLTLASASNLDAAFARADAFATASSTSLNQAQRQLLASGASIQRIHDVAQATRTLDSLSGHAHALAQDMLHDQTATSATRLDARLERLPRGTQGGAWSSALRHEGGFNGSYSMDGQASGYDQWLSPKLLVGSSIASNQGRMQFERMGGHGQGESPMASVYAHYRNGDWHATGLVGAGRTVLQLDRPIDLGAAGEHVAHSRREIGQAFLHGELGRRIALGRGRLTPFVAVDYSALHGDGFIEQGDTGFELVAQPARSTQLSAAAGARYARGWHFAGNSWLRLDLDARYQQHLADEGDALRAAFVGTPDALFDLSAWSHPGHSAAMTLGLTGGMDDRWAWSLDYARRFGGDAAGSGWFVGLRRDF